MNAGFDLVFAGYALDERTITHPPLVKRHFGVHGAAMAVHKIVKHNHIFALGLETLHGGAPDIPCPTCHENRH